MSTSLGSLMLALAVLSLPARAQKNSRLCPDRLSSYPMIGSDDVPADKRARFEIRKCGIAIQLVGFRSNENRPSLVVDTEQSSISLLIHTGGVLLVEVAAGSSSPTYILQMKKGVPTLIAQVDGVGDVQYRQEHPAAGDYVVFTIPRKTHPDASGKFPQIPPRVVRLKIFDD